ncbi:Retinitis pigmentosa 9 protein [Chamberlinius hualienensis]
MSDKHKSKRSKKGSRKNNRKKDNEDEAMPPPGLVKEDEEKPEDCIPDLPENAKARDFLAHAPTKGLWMPLGKEVKVMKCWRCKTYGHRTGDKECPMFISGNLQCEQFRFSREDPMHDYLVTKNKQESLDRVRQLQLLLEETTSDSSSSSSDSDHHKRKRKKHSSKSSKKCKNKKSHKKRKH